MTAPQIVTALLAIAVLGVLLTLLFLRGTDAQTRLLCRDAARRLGSGYRFAAGAGLAPNRILAKTPGYRLEAALHPGRRTGWRVDVELVPSGGEYLEPYPAEARALLRKARSLIPGETTIERAAIRYGFHQGALLDAAALAELIGFVVELHEKLQPPDRSERTDPAD